MKRKPREFGPGHFSALIDKHRWPPMFQSQLATTLPAMSYMANVPRPKLQGVGNGFDVKPLGLKGAVEHTVRWEALKVAG